MAYRNGQDIILWRSDTGLTENLGKGYGNDPVALGGGYVVWQNTTSYQVVRRNLTGGSSSFVRNGAPTGISRVLSGGTIKLVDEDRLSVSGTTQPSCTNDLTVGEGPQSGVIGFFGSNPSFVIFPGEESFTPRAATDGTLYAIATWGSGGVRVAVITK